MEGLLRISPIGGLEIYYEDGITDTKMLGIGDRLDVNSFGSWTTGSIGKAGYNGNYVLIIDGFPTSTITLGSGMKARVP